MDGVARYFRQRALRERSVWRVGSRGAFVCVSFVEFELCETHSVSVRVFQKPDKLFDPPSPNLSEI